MLLWLVVKFHPAALAILAFSADAKPMAENLYRFIWSWLVCVIVTILVSLATKPKPASELQGLVYGFALLPSDEAMPIYRRPIFAAALVAAVFVGLNLHFLVGQMSDSKSLYVGLSRKERMLRALRREPVDRLPTQSNYTRAMGRLLCEHFGIAEAELPERLGNHLLRVDIDHPRRTNADGSIEFDWWGAGWDTRTEGYWHAFSPLERLARPRSAIHGPIRTMRRFSARPSGRFSAMARTISSRRISECVFLNEPGRCADSMRCSWTWWNAPSGWRSFWTASRRFRRLSRGDSSRPASPAGISATTTARSAPCCSPHGCGEG